MRNFNDTVVAKCLEALDGIKEENKELNEGNIIDVFNKLLRKASGNSKELLAIERSKALTEDAYKLGTYVFW